MLFIDLFTLKFTMQQNIRSQTFTVEHGTNNSDTS